MTHQVWSQCQTVDQGSIPFMQQQVSALELLGLPKPTGVFPMAGYPPSDI
jgi:hypothetical protein